MPLSRKFRFGLMLAAILASPLGAGADPVTVKALLDGLPKKLPKGITQQIRLVDASTGNQLLVSTGRGGKRSTFSAPPQPSILLVNHLSRTKKDNRRGIAPLFKPGKLAARSTTTRVRMRGGRAVSSLAASARPAAPLSAPSAQIRVGVPPGGFTVSGPGTNGTMATAVAELTIGSIVRNAPCYDKPSGVVVIESDPRVLDARRREFDLCGAGVTDPSTCVADRYSAPDNSIRGSVLSQGGQVTITLELVGPNGDVIATESATGSLSEFFQLIEEAAKRLAARICPGQLVVETATCRSTACECCGSQFCIPGHTWEHRFTGTARGGEGSTVTFNLHAAYTALECDGWSTGSCGAIPCCVREPGQPEQLSFTAAMPYPFPVGPEVCICPPVSPTAVSFLVQLVSGGAYEEVERIVDCPQ